MDSNPNLYNRIMKTTGRSHAFESDDDEVLIVPDTPSPVFARSAPRRPVTMFGSGTIGRINSNKPSSPDKSGLPLPGQLSFAQERANALRRKRLNDKMSPRKNQLPNNAIHIGSPIKSATVSNDAGTSKLFLGNSVSPLSNGFVKSSVLLRSPEKHGGDGLNTAGKGSTNDSQPTKSSTVSSAGALEKLKQLRRRKKEKREATSTHQCFSPPKVQPAFHKRNYGWPSDSDSDSSDDDTFPNFRLNPHKHKSPSTVAETLQKKIKLSTPVSPAQAPTVDNTSKFTQNRDISPMFVSPQFNALIHRPTSNRVQPEMSDSPMLVKAATSNSVHKHVSSVSLPKLNKPRARERKEKGKSGRQKMKTSGTPTTTFVTPSASGTTLSPLFQRSAVSVMGVAGHDDTLTPETKHLLESINQVHKDEELAKSLQEELDREFALSLQNAAGREGGANEQGSPTMGHAHHHPAYFSPQEGYACPMHVRGRTRGRTARATRDSQELDAELMDLIQETYNSIHAGLGTQLHSPVMSNRGRRRNGRHMVMFSPDGQGNDYEDLMRLAESIGEVKPKGLSKNDINLLPIVKYKKGGGGGAENLEECNICMMEYETGDSQKILPCFHTFHAKCIDKWIKQNSTCPVCRVEVTVS